MTFNRGSLFSASMHVPERSPSSYSWWPQRLVIILRRVQFVPYPPLTSQILTFGWALFGSTFLDADLRRDLGYRWESVVSVIDVHGLAQPTYYCTAREAGYRTIIAGHQLIFGQIT